MENTSDATTLPVDPTPVPPTPPATTEAAPPVDAPSIDAHAEAFAPGPKGETTEERTARQEAAAQRARDEAGKFTRHRSHKNKAGAEDVPRIRELTAKWREEEKRSAELTAKYQALEKEVASLKAPKPAAAPAPPKPFDAAEPKIEDFNSYDDPYHEWTLAKAEYRAEKREAEKAAAQHSQASTQYQTEQQKRAEDNYRQAYSEFKAIEQQFSATKPDYYTVVTPQFGSDFPPVLYAALLDDARGPEYVYNLASKPELLAEAILLSEGKNVTDQSVALMRRVLSARVPVATAGSTAAAKPAYIPPKPPNPARTGPMKPLDEPPSEAGSIADHRRYFGTRR